jgi:uncharacterized protein YbjT (DUF2867 family)
MIVVTGATGNVGRPLLTALTAAGERVTAVSRTNAELPPGVTHHGADLTDAESVRPALEGADRLFLLPTGELLASAGSPSALLDVAKAAGVQHVVLLSSQASATRPQAISHARLREFEDAVKQSGLTWTILRPSGFASNSYAFIQTVRADRTVTAPFGDVGLPVVDPADIAGVAAAALLDPAAHVGRTYVLTGPTLITPRQQAEALGQALNEPLTFVELSRDDARTFMLQFMPEPVVEGTLDILGEPTAEEQTISPDVTTVLGRSPASYPEWAQRNIAAFR